MSQQHHLAFNLFLTSHPRDGEKLVRLAAGRQKALFVGHILHYHEVPWQSLCSPIKSGSCTQPAISCLTKMML